LIVGLLIECFARISLLRLVLPFGNEILYFPSCSGKTLRIGVNATEAKINIVCTVLEGGFILLLGRTIHLLPTADDDDDDDDETVLTGAIFANVLESLADNIFSRAC
jgi:hypothetical protein